MLMVIANTRILIGRGMNAPNPFGTNVVLVCKTLQKSSLEVDESFERSRENLLLPDVAVVTLYWDDCASLDENPFSQG